MMDLEESNSAFRNTQPVERASSASSSTIRCSSTFSYAFPRLAVDDIEISESVSEAANIRDRSLKGSSMFRLSLDHFQETSVVVPVSDDASFQPEGSIADFPDAIVQSADVKMEDTKEEDSWMNYSSRLSLLALFGILGVISRFYLQKLFGPGVVGFTSDMGVLYLDLPSNMVGSFLMGWLGVVFKGDISKVSENLAIALTTGYLGSLTTFSGWNQKMLELSVEGHWVFSVLGYLVGLLLASACIDLGKGTAESFKCLLNKRAYSCKVEKYKGNLIATVVLLSALGVWGVCIALEITEFNNASSNAQLLLACIVGPFGVWTRWYLARLNGRGLGKGGRLKWFPFGTLAANVLAICIMAALATLKKAVIRTNTCNTVATGIQIGFPGCLSTVSTFIAEYESMSRSKYPWTAYAYALSTIFISFLLGTLAYSLPVWVKGYD